VSTNPYAPPAADVADIAPPEELAAEAPFFPVSVLKLAVMSVCTFNVYNVYWFYKHWQRIAEREQAIEWPVFRAIFAVFFSYPCFARIRDYGIVNEVESRHAGPLAMGFILTSVTWRLPDPWSWISMTSFPVLLPVQHFANTLNALASPTHDRNSRFGGWNWVAVIVGGLLLLLTMAGAFLPEA
jgi:hypothetical protein